MCRTCDYGCGQLAIHQFKSGRYCCAKSTSKCPAMLAKNSDIIKTLRHGKGNDYWTNGHPRGSKNGTSLKGKTYNEIYGPEEALRRRREISIRSKQTDTWSKIAPEVKERISLRQRERIIARYEQGWMPKAGRCKKIRYVSQIAGEMLLDGTWELLVAQWLDEKSCKWYRNTKRFPYNNLKGSLSHYTPDFYVEELGGYLEVKGYETSLDRCRWSQFRFPLTVWKKEHIKAIQDGAWAGW